MYVNPGNDYQLIKSVYCQLSLSQHWWPRRDLNWHRRPPPVLPPMKGETAVLKRTSWSWKRGWQDERECERLQKLGNVRVAVGEAVEHRCWSRRHAAPPQPSKVIPAALVDSSFVYVHHGGAKLPLSPTYCGPFAVVSRFPKYFILDMGDRQESISVDRLKPHLGSAIFTPAVAPCRGRPLKLVAPSDAPLGGE